MNESIGTGRGFHSPKKKLSFRNKESSIENVRRDLKDGKDISARNLMAKLDLDQEKSDSDSTIEEVMVIEEETEAVEDEEYIEEIFDDSDDDDSYLEPLPPPIEIPEALQVKDDEDNKRIANDGSEDDSDDDESKEEKIEGPVAVVAVQPSQVSKVMPAPVQETKLKSEGSFIAKEEPNAAKESVVPSTQYLKPQKETFAEEKEDDGEEKDDKIQAMTCSAASPGVKAVRPMKQRGMSHLEPDHGAAISTQTPALADQHTTNHCTNGENLETDPSIAWQKPDWTKNTKLRPTGKSAKDNLAKPITILPHLQRRTESESTTADAVTAPSTPVSSKQKVKIPPKTPTPSSKTITTSRAPQCPKSAPSQPKVLVSMDQDDLPKIEWTKPDWTRKKILRDTSKGQKLMSGQEISRPIGGIRPVQD